MAKRTSLPKRVLKTAVVLGGIYTAWQASQTTKKQGGQFTLDKFIPNFKSQAAENIRLVGGAGKALAGKYFGLFADSKSGKKAAVPENETARNIYETVKTVAPDTVKKVEDYVEDVQKNAPEYRVETEKAIDDAAENVIKYLGLEDEKKPAEEKKAVAEEKPAVEVKAAAEEKPAVEVKPAAEEKPAVEKKPAAEKKSAAEKKPAAKEKKLVDESKADKPRRPRKVEKDDKEDKPKKAKKEDTEDK